MADTAREVSDVRADRSGHVLVVQVDRPSARNAFRWETWTELNAHLAAGEADRSVRAVVLTGAGGVFSSGGDVKTSAAGGTGVMAPVARLQHAHSALRSLVNMTTPVLAAIEGYAVGVGWSLAQACDLIIAAEDSYLYAPFLERGLVPDGGLAWWLTRNVGHQAAFEALVLGGRIAAPDALRRGLISRTTPRGDALRHAVEMAEELSKLPPDTVARTKRMLRTAQTDTFPAFLETELMSAALNAYTDAPDEGRRAFSEGRQAKFG
ncbi:enoyl-CoA hydratase/isomerase family protein [Dactylosporangium sp. CA-092794]|uniref:enoyl-CoA hydratase/isomerase family protein n=1 Tax=Dactylosporangium sp. CA-092794 TaxID=3239929 RepID=UPI003D8A879F